MLKHKTLKDYNGQTYWASFNIKFEDYDWHRMYYSITGIHDPRFIPQPVAERLIYLHYNRQDFICAYADKNRFADIVPTLEFPKTIAKRVNSRYYDANDKYYGEEISEPYLNTVYAAMAETGDDTIILKQTVGSSQGKGIQKCEIREIADLKNLLENNKIPDFAVQTAIRQHRFFRQFNEDSVNIIRINTWRKGNEVFILSPCIRFGVKGSYTDVAFKNGIEIINCVKIDSCGRIDKHYVTLDGENIPLPDSFELVVPQWDEIVRQIKEAALQLPYFDFIGWDITVDDRDHVICIEYNLKWPGTIVYQFAHGPLAGEKTDDLLAFLKEEQYVRMIPKCVRIKP